MLIPNRDLYTRFYLLYNVMRTKRHHHRYSYTIELTILTLDFMIVLWITVAFLEVTFVFSMIRLYILCNAGSRRVTMLSYINTVFSQSLLKYYATGQLSHFPDLLRIDKGFCAVVNTLVQEI